MMEPLPAPQPPPTARRPRAADGVLVSVLAGLLMLGLLAVYTAGARPGFSVFGDSAFFLKRQVAWAVLGIVAAGVTYRLDYRAWRRYSVPIMTATVLMLIALLFLGATRFGGQRWVLGGGSVQPSELAKFAVILYMADWLAGKRDAIRDVRLGLIPFAILIGVVCGLVLLQPDFSTACLIGAVAVAMFYTAGADLRQMVVAGIFAAAGLGLLVVQSPYRLQRLLTFRDPWADPAGAGYQVRLTMASLTGGGLTGTGLGGGQHKLVLPTPHTDAVFAVLGEELGLLGSLTVLVLFALLTWRGFRIAAGSPDRYACLVAVGMTAWLGSQALLNMAGVAAAVPFTGIPLPFLSYGGSSLVVSLAAAGLLLNLSTRVDPARAKAYAHLDLRRRDRRAHLSRAVRAQRRGRRGW